MSRKILLSALLALSLPAGAGDITSIGNHDQGEFRALSEDLGAAFSYKGVTPATSLGVLGFDVGIEVTDTRLEHGSLFERAGAGGHSDLLVPKLHVHKGLPGGFGIGAFVATASGISANLFGADLRYAIVEDRLSTPAIALRLSGTKATGLGDVSLTTAALDAVVSKQFTAITPYAGAGVVRVMSKAHNAALSDESFGEGRIFGGINLNLLTANLAFEAEKMGGATSLSAKLGLRF